MEAPIIKFDFSKAFKTEEDLDNEATVDPITISDSVKENGIVFDFSKAFKKPDYESISTARQLAYGFAQEPQILGSLLRGLKAAYRSIGSDKTITESFKEVEAERQKEILEDFPEFRGLTEQEESLTVLGGRVSSSLIDPVLFLVPWTKVAAAGKVAVVATGAGVAAGESALRDYALKGEVNNTNLVVSAVLGGTVSLGGDALSRFISNRRTKGQPVEILEEITADLADTTKIVPAVLEEPLKPMNQVIQEWRRTLDLDARIKQGEIMLTEDSPQIDFVKAFNRFQRGQRQSMTVQLTQEETTSLATSTAKIVEKAPIKEEELIKVATISSLSKEINDLNKAIAALKKKDPQRKELINKLTQKHNALKEHVISSSQLRVEKAVDVLEDMATTGNLTANIMQKVLYETARPVGFGAAGGVMGLSTMEEDDGWGHILSYVGTGVAIGMMQKKIQRSETFTNLDKQTGDLLIQDIGDSWLNKAASQLKYVTGMSTATRMDAMGGWNKIIGNKLFSKLDSNVESVEARTQRLQADYLSELFQITGAPAERSFATRAKRVFGKDVNYDDLNDKNTAINTVAAEVMRGYVKIGDLSAGYTGLRNNLVPLDVEDITEINRMVPLLKALQDRMGVRLEEVGIVFKKIENYGLHQIWNKDRVAADYNEFLKDLQYAVVMQERNRAKVKNKTFTEEAAVKARDKAVVMANKISGRFINVKNKLYAGSSDTPIFTQNDKGEYKFRVAADAFEKQRMLTDVEATKFMYEKGYLHIHAGNSLASSGTAAIKVAEFSEAFGANGEVFNIALQETRKAFEKAMQGKPTAVAEKLKKQLTAYEMQLTGSAEAYWGGYGSTLNTELDVFTKAFTTLANVTYLTTVSIVNLGDLVQPFTNSSYGAAFKTLAQRAGKEKVQFSEMSNFKYSKDYERDLSSFMRKGSTGGTFSTRLDNINDFYFFAIGLKKVTEMSRNFAYDVGVNRAFELAKKQKLNKNELKELSEMKLTKDDLVKIGNFETVEKAFENDASIGRLLDIAGRSSSDRDSIIPSVGNRLLFTQTNNSAIRSIGQFMSWAQAKTTQANTLLGRVENGDAKLAIKILAAAPVYGAFLELKRTLSPTYIRDDEDDKKSTFKTLNFIGDSMKLSGSFNNAVLDKALETFKSAITYDQGIGESLIPSLGLLFDVAKGGVKAGVDVSEGNVLKALKRVTVSLPVVSQVSGYVEKITGEPLIEVTPPKTKQRAVYKLGGEVLNVPNVPVKPEQRIDKMTGVPYDQQAGAAFVDNDDPLRRLGFKGGGVVTDPLGRMGFGKGGKVPDDMKRIDGTTKSLKGFLGPIVSLATGKTMTEVSIGGGKDEPLIPVLVPTLTKDEIETMRNIDFEGNPKAIPEGIIKKALQHAEERKAQGLSPFYQDGEEKNKILLKEGK
jgi:hypothetical protein